MKLTKEDSWAIVGIYYGYPKCCIKEFTELKHIGHPTCIEAVHKNQGFVPCEKHRQEILDGKITIESLIKDRICPVEYPEDNDNIDEEHFNNWIKSLGLTSL